MLFPILTIFCNAGLLEALLVSRQFIEQEVPKTNVLFADPVQADSALSCSFRCLGKNVTGDCNVFFYNKTTLNCHLGDLSEIDRSKENNSTQLVWKLKGCSVPENPINGKWYCETNIKQEKCFLVCFPGYVAKSFRGLYCYLYEDQAKWDKSPNEFECLPTVIAITGGFYFPMVGQLSTFGPDGQVRLPNHLGHYFRQHIVQYFRGQIIYCGGYYVRNKCYRLNFTSGGEGTSMQISTKIRINSASVIVQDRYYIIGGDLAESQAQAEYILEADGLSYDGMLTPELTDANTAPSCAIRFTDKSFVNIVKDMVTEYDISAGTSKALPNLNIPRQRFGCDSYLDEDEELVSIVAGGNTVDSAYTAEIFKPSFGQWIIIGNLTYPRESHAVVTTSDGVFAIGGENNPTGKVEKLDIKTKTWIDTGLNYDPDSAFFAATAIPVDILPP
ncbi:uncharacterized protein LOC111710060 [Eurytemora carolleeae]|uniref:uncharacterized protein LOC111710060 n=1 Tax=Eurytemora carolleeae TaxID=1294199 RepID=UPI000C762E38|nr:uncharacterized protein LOC111710060 [Eurytemora carolleeae]|eukprot:XP_023339849.1 uncharacterized protein LOC111710060 [Eurytemora affinis]